MRQTFPRSSLNAVSKHNIILAATHAQKRADHDSWHTAITASATLPTITRNFVSDEAVR